LGNVDYSPQDEEHPLKPRSPYGAAKAAARHIVKVYRESYNLFAIQGLLYNHESPRRGEEFVTRKITKEVARIKKALSSGSEFEPLELGNIYARRDWSHAKDFVKGIWLMLNNKTPKEYILASGETYTVKNFIERAFNIAEVNGDWYDSGVEERFINSNGQTLVKINPEFYRPAEVDLLLGDPVKAKLELKWRPEISFEDLVREMVISDLKNINLTL
jgi:GDPmannose 4,6-dehydratase